MLAHVIGHTCPSGPTDAKSATEFFDGCLTEQAKWGDGDTQIAIILLDLPFDFV
jgi:hypothetical protein